MIENGFRQSHYDAIHANAIPKCEVQCEQDLSTNIQKHTKIRRNYMHPYKRAD